MPRIILPHDFTPRFYQLPYMRYFDGGGKRGYWVVHRRSGKDFTAGHQLAKMAHEQVGLYWHMLPTYKQARKVIWQGFTNDGKRILDSFFPPELVAGRNETDMRLDLKCGSVIQYVGSDSYDTLVGSNPTGVIFSEFALNHPAAWGYLRPILAANKNAWASFITTPRGLNHAWTLWKAAQGDPTWFTQLLTVDDTGVLSPADIASERALGMPDALIRSEYYCDWQAALVGAVWGDLIEDLEKQRGGILDFEFEHDGIFTAWDLGMADSTAIWWFRPTSTGVEFIDYYEAHGKPLSHFADVIERRGLPIVKHWLPHDARAHHLGTEVSVLEQLWDRFGHGAVAIGPRMALLDGIQAGRWLLQQPGTRFHATRCAAGLECLRAYHYEYDEETKTYSNKPEHDFSSHGADAYRYASVVSRVAGIYKPEHADEEKPAPIELLSLNKLTLEMLYEERERSLPRVVRL